MPSKRLALKKRRRHGLTPKRVKWRMLRISWKTHDMLKDMKRHSNVPMLEFVEAVVTHIYGGGVVSMQALTFYMMYLDNKPTFVVAAKDAETAENGLRSMELGKGLKSVKAVSLADASLEDVQRLGTQAILSQLTQVSAMLQMLLQKR
jgi:aspartate/glutamate racemase